MIEILTLVFLGITLLFSILIILAILLNIILFSSGSKKSKVKFTAEIIPVNKSLGTETGGKGETQCRNKRAKI